MIQLTPDDWNTLQQLTCGDDDTLPSDEDIAIYRAGISAGVARMIALGYIGGSYANDAVAALNKP